MADEMVTSKQSSQASTFRSINILVVDDDTTCLSIVAAILKSWNYEVVTVKHPIEALCTLRIRGGSFDLVITDVHMPDMNGFELQKKIHEEFKLPVVFMSVDDKDGIILKGLQSGGAFFIVKPIAPDELKNLWQYTVAKKKGKTIIEEIGSNEEMSVQETSQTDKGSNEDVESTSSANKYRKSTKESKRKALPKDTNNFDKGENKDDCTTPKKAKVVWTNALHGQFLEAIRSIGLERAVPKKILELMNVPGITRENVASHLQKYRIFLKRVSQASYKIQSATERNMVERTFRSTFASGRPSSSMFNRSQLRCGGYIPVPNLGNNISCCSTQETSSTNFSMPRFGCTQSLLLCNQGNLKKPTIGNGSAKRPYNHQTSLLLHGNTSGGTGLMTGPNLFEMYQQKNQLAPQTQSFNNGMLNYNSTTCGVHGYNDVGITGYGKMGAFNNSNNLNLKPKPNGNSYKNNDAGYRMAGDGRFAGLGFKGGEASTNYNSNNFLMNGKQNNESMITMPLLSGNFGDHLAQEVITSNGFQSQGQVSPTTFNRAIQQENNSVTPMPSTPLVQQNSFGNGQGESDRFFGLLDNVSDFDSNSFLQPFGEDDLSFNFLNQINIQSPTQQDGSFSQYHVEANLLVNQQSLGQKPGGGEMVSNFDSAKSQSDEYVPSFEQNPSQASFVSS
ncbi:two-component response regulator ARR14-like [Camellia sinensis]|uniref:two-component response regulator ARR14-like n=1 Tax=Camellia sinensis TaxID=4442 RepID=UPI001035C1C9|nr:two-component response regulator ARR14-like [Camellia sinensis]